jgi:glycosyltransferase involved in cell wall biosynthesis
VEVVEATTFGELARTGAAAGAGPLVVVGEPALVPPSLLDRAIAFLNDDERIATVSFFSNSAGPLSFPFHHQPLPLPVRGHDATSLTQVLRATSPLPGPVPISAAAGPLVIISAGVLAILHTVADPPDGGFTAWLREVSGQARRRGLATVLDAATYVLRAEDLSDEAERSGVSDADRRWLNERDGYLAALEAEETASESSPLELAFTTARAKVVGVEILVDGSSLGPLETGTQVGLLALAEALAAREDVSGLTITLAADVPSYVRRLQANPKVRFALAPPGADIGHLGRHDIGYRPIQPDHGFDLDSFETVCRRTVVNVLDLIAYEIGTYHSSPQAWLDYRSTLAGKLAAVDGVTTISRDVKNQLLQFRLPVEPDRVFPVPYGTEHLRGAQPMDQPQALAGAGMLTRPFIVCLGTNYSHKNRDLARLGHVELTRRGHDIDLVLVGAVVPYGSSRVDEAVASRQQLTRGCVLSLPDVSSAERNWLLRHASAVVYPTSAEGFGLVPFEAATFGTPTVHVAFGPLREIGGAAPVAAADWRPSSLADALERLLLDPALAQRQVEHVRSTGEAYSWATTAETLVGVFRDLLAVPARRPASS